MKIGAVILAAGASSRLGRPKQLLQHRGQSLVRRTAVEALGAGLSPIAVVAGAEHERIEAELRGLAVLVVPNEDWSRGIGTSIGAGVETLTDCDAVIILACDQPHVDAKLLRRLMETQERTGKPMVGSAYSNTLGVPALFARAYFAKLCSLPAQQGAKALLSAQPNDLAEIDFPEGAIDIDTLADCRMLSRSEKSDPAKDIGA